MAEAATDPRRGKVRQGLISKGVTALSQAILWLVLSLVFSILVEWTGMVLWWPEEGTEHSRRMLEVEIRYLDADFRHSLVTSDPAEFAKTVADNIYYRLFELTRVVDLLAWVSRPPARDEKGLRTRLYSLYRPVADFVIATMLVTSWVVYLALPFSLHPTFVILPFATLFALSVAVTASSFKKYL